MGGRDSRGKLDTSCGLDADGLVKTEAELAKSSILRLALAMRGGVSLAVWIGGAMYELDRLQHQSPFVQALLGPTVFKRAEIDILTGASAGGLNAAIGGFAMARERPVNLREVWIRLADIDSLLESDPRRPRSSVLDGDVFFQRVISQLKEIDGEPHDAGASAPGGAGTGKATKQVQMFLAATVFNGIRVARLVDPLFSDRRREAFFNFRHLAGSGAFTDLDADDAIEQVGTAARASASFPVAFEPVEVDTYGFRGRIHLPETQETPPTVRVLDGGIVDNIPVARAIRATTSAPATDPVRRWVAFLHPNPEGLVRHPATATGLAIPSVPAVLKDVAASLSDETLLDDLEVLEEHNREAESIKVQRKSLFDAALQDRVANPDAALLTVDAYRIYASLDDPVSNLGWLPVGKVAPQSPIATWSDDDRYQLRMRIVADVQKYACTTHTTPRPYARIARLAQFMIEWIRWAERAGGSEFSRQRRVTYDVLLVAKLADAALSGSILQCTGDPVTALTASLERLERSKGVRRLVRCVRCRLSEGNVDLTLPDHLQDGLDDSEAMAALTNLARGVVPESPQESGGCSSEELLDTLSIVGARIFNCTRSIKPTSASAYSVLNDGIEEDLGWKRLPWIAWWSPKATERCVRSALLTIDAAEAELHRGTTRGAPQTLEYVRISGAATGPFARPSSTGDALPCFKRVVEEESRQTVDPDRKLAGNKLGSFSAFLSPRFRANDWMWGRMDAASEIVALIFRPEYLAPVSPRGLLDRVRCIVLHPLDRVDLADEARGLADDAESVCEDLWRENCSEIFSELGTAQAAPRDAKCLPVTIRTIQARWHLELAIREIPKVIKQPLDASDHPSGWPLEPLGEPWEKKTPKERIQFLLDRYEETPTKVADLWGRRHTTGLGVRAVRATARALVPGRRHHAIPRIAIGVPMLIAVAAVLSRGAFLIAWNALLNVVLVPRLEGLFVAAIVLLSSVASMLFWVKFVRRKGRGRRRAMWTAIATVLLIIVGATSHMHDWLAAEYPMPSTWPPEAELLVAAAAVAVASGFAVVCLWLWARPWAIVIASLGTSLVMGYWVIVGAWIRADEGLWEYVAWFRSLWAPAVLLVIVFTGIALHWRVEARPPRQVLG